MRWCPECGREFPPEIVVCRDCGQALEAEAPKSERVPDMVSLVRLCSVSGVVEGSMLKGALESQGLHPWLLSHDLPAYTGVLRDWSARGWGEIRVPADEVEEAQLVIEDFREAVRRTEGGPATDPESAEAEPDAGGEPPSFDEAPPVRESSPADESSAEREASDAPEPPRAEVLYPLCAVHDVAEGKMLEGALRSQGLHPVLALDPGREMAPGRATTAPAGELRVPGNELLEARAVLGDFRRAAARLLDERNRSDGEAH